MKFFTLLAVFILNNINATIFSINNVDGNKMLYTHLEISTKNGIISVESIKTDEDKEFLIALFQNPNVMKEYGSSEIRTREQTLQRIQTSLNRMHNLQPTAMLMIKLDGNSIGYCVSGIGEEKGTSELAIALSPEHQRQGIAQAILRTFFETYIPEIKKINQDPNHQLYPSFSTAFLGLPLKRVCATSNIRNATMNLLIKSGFSFEQLSEYAPIIADFSNQNLTEEEIKQKLMEIIDCDCEKEKVIQTIKSKLGNSKFGLILPNGQIATINWSSRFQTFKMHFQRDI